MATNKDVSLVIKAKNEASRAIDSVAEALKALDEVQKNAAKSGEKIGSVSEQLAKDLSNLTNETKGLSALGTIATYLDKAAGAVARLETEVAKTSTDIDRLKQASEAASTTTVNLAAAIERETKALQDQKNASRQANDARKEANRELGKAETALRRLEERATKAKTAPTTELTAQIAAQRQLVASLQAAQQAATTRYETEASKQKEVSTTLKALNAQLTASASNETKLASEIEDTTARLARQNDALGVAKTGLNDISTIAGRASATLGSIAVTQESIAQASKNAADEIARVNAALSRQSGITSSAGTTSSARGPAPATQATDRSVRAYQEQIGAVRNAQRAWLEAEEEVKRLAVAMRGIEQPSAQMQRDFNVARAAAQQAKNEFLAQGVALSQLRNASSGNFSAGMAEGQRRLAVAAAEAENRLKAVKAQTEATASTSRAAAGAVAAMRPAFGAAASGAKSFGDEVARSSNRSREALSITQRLRSEVLSLASGYLGLQAGLGQIGGVINAFQTLEAAQGRLGAVFDGDQGRISEELTFLRAQADRLGISFGTLSDEYGKFAIAANQANFSNDSTRKIFLSVAEAARVNRLSVEQTSGVFLALTQMISKGKVSSEELRRQLGDRLPGAFSIFANALNLTTAQLDKMMQDGQILANEGSLLKFADELNKRFGPQLQKSLQGVTTQIGRLQNNIFGAQLDVANGGFIAALEQALAKLNEFFQSTEGQAFFNSLGAALGKFVVILAQVPQYFTEIQTALAIFASVKIGTSLADMAARFIDTGKAVRGLGAEYQFIGPKIENLTRSQAVLRTGFFQVISSIDNYRNALLTSTSGTAVARSGILALNATLGIVRTSLFAAANIARAFWTAIGGLPGLVLTGITYAIGSWITSTNDATTALQVHQQQLQAIVEGYKSAKGEAKNWADEIKTVTLAQAIDNAEKLQKSYDKVVGRIKGLSLVLRAGFMDFPDLSPEAKQLKVIEDAVGGLEKGTLTIQRFTQILNQIALDPAQQDFKDIALQILNIVNTAADGEPTLNDLAKGLEQAGAKVRWMQGTASEADKVLLGLTKTLSGVADAAGQTTDNYKQFDAAMSKLAEFVPGLAEKMKELKKYQEVDDAYLAGLRAIGDMGMKSSAGIDALIERLTELRDLAKAGIDVGNLVKGLDQYNTATEKSEKLIANFEGFRAKAYVDNDGRYRVGFGSDTTTSPTGQVSTTTANSVSTVADALRDLNRRIQDYMAAIETAIGSDKFAQLSEDQKAVLASLVHNYGTLPDRIVEAFKSGNTGDVAGAIVRLGDDNNGLNRSRREQEAAIFSGRDTSNDVDYQIKKLDEGKKKQDAFTESLTEYTKRIKEEADARKVSNKEGEIAKAIAEKEEEARKAGLPLLESGKRLTEEQTQAIRDAVAAKYDSMHADEAAKEQRQQEQEAIQNLIGLDQQRKSALQELQLAMQEGDQGKAQELRQQVADLNAEIERGIPLAMQLAQALGDQRGIASLQKITLHAKQMQVELVSGRQIAGMLADGLSNAFGTALQGIGQAIVGAKSWKDALIGVRNAFLQFAADFLIQIGQMILKQMLLNALQSAFGGATGGVGGAIAGAVNALIRHDGGVVGAVDGPSRSIPALAFANAVRYHGGGLPGLKSDEVGTILQKGEEVLEKNDPRNILNGGAAANGGDGGSSGAKSIKNVLVWDPADLAAAMASGPGEKVVMTIMKRNAPTLKKMLGG